MTFGRQRKCAICRSYFKPMSMTHKACGPACAELWAIADRAKREKKGLVERKRAAAKERQERKVKLQAIKRLPDLIADAQAAFNAYIRYRDKDETCIDCGKPFEPMRPGGSIDAGHFRSRGAAPHLRFNEDNCFAQRKNCNRPGGATYDDFRAGVIARRGLAAVEALENNNEPHKWTRDEVIGIRDHYRAKLKELKKEREHA